MTIQKTSGTKMRNGNIELLRFFFAISVVMHHALLNHYRGGWIGVEFFFMVTGYFMAASTIECHKDETFDVNIEESGKHFIKRVKAIYPYFLLSCVPAFAVTRIAQVAGGSALGEALKHVAFLPYDLLFAQNLGYPVLACIGTLWYLSAMFVAIWILYPIMRRHGKAYSLYFAPMVNFFLCGFLLHNQGAISIADTYVYGWLNLGVVRAVAMISLGTFVYHISGWIKDRSAVNKKLSRMYLTLAEVFSYTITFLYMFCWKAEYAPYDYLVILVIAIGLSITTSGSSLLYGLFDNKVVMYFGKYSMVLFMNHAYWLFNIVPIASYYHINLSEGALKGIGIALSLLSSMIIMTIVDAIKRGNKK
jgi:peptidoglycan/LPS O-acetylase OafA/YrhL